MELVEMGDGWFYFISKKNINALQWEIYWNGNIFNEIGKLSFYGTSTWKFTPKGIRQNSLIATQAKDQTSLTKIWSYAVYETIVITFKNHVCLTIKKYQTCCQIYVILDNNEKV